MVVFLFVLFTAKELSIPLALIVLAALALSYPALPAVLIWFYRTRDVRLTFEVKDPHSYWIETVAQPVLVVCAGACIEGSVHPVLVQALPPEN